MNLDGGLFRGKEWGRTRNSDGVMNEVEVQYRRVEMS
jgi:hypothetical protein